MRDYFFILSWIGLLVTTLANMDRDRLFLVVIALALLAVVMALAVALGVMFRLG